MIGNQFQILRKQYDERGGGYGGGPARYKHIIIGIDGTWQAAFRDRFQSNVYRLNLALNFEDRSRIHPQIFIYSAGVGTANRSSRVVAGAIGEGLDELVLEAYINLVSNYVPGDKVYIFGFSRGAVAARALTGFISYSGLLKANSSSLIEHAWRYFVGAEAIVNYPEQRGENTHPNLHVDFLGVWDTVPGPYKRDDLRKKYRFQSLKLDPSVKCGVHILSIDETRRSFAPLLWEGRGKNQIMEQIWLPGVHGDIGGGYSEAFISTLSLLLMIDRLAHHCPELDFDTGYIEKTLVPIIQNQEVVINDEWRNYIGRFIKPLARSYRMASLDPDHNHLQHPFIEFIRERKIKIRGAERTYVPSFNRRNGGTILPNSSFSEKSWHAVKLQAIFSERFPNQHVPR